MKAALAWATIDTLTCLLLVVLAAINPPVEKQRTSAIETFGRYVIVVDWPNNRDDDVDTWVRDPNGNLVWFASSRAGLMHLEQDDLGLTSDTEGDFVVSENRERVILRGIVPGEYVVNVHAYRLNDGPPTPVTTTLWQLQGTDHIVYTRSLVLAAEGDEQTAFRFRLTSAGQLRGVNRLSASLVTT